MANLWRMESCVGGTPIGNVTDDMKEVTDVWNDEPAVVESANKSFHLFLFVVFVGSML